MLLESRLNTVRAACGLVLPGEPPPEMLQENGDGISGGETYHGGQNDYQNNSKIILICNRTNRKLLGKLNSFRVGNGNFENSKLFEGLVIFEHNTQPHT